MKLFLDANIVFTAAYSGQGVSGSLFRLAESGLCTLMTSAYAVDEAGRNLKVKAPATIPEFELLCRLVVLVKEPVHITVLRMMQLPLVAKDAPILAAAAEAVADILVTGDRRDFGHLYGKVIEGVVVLTPVEALTMVLKHIEKP